MPIPIRVKLTLDELSDLLAGLAIYLPPNSPELAKIQEVVLRLRKQVDVP